MARCWRRLRRAVPSHPIQLAALRIAVCAALLSAPDLYEALQWSGAPAGLLVAPRHALWPLGLLPVDPSVARVALALAIGGAASGLVGFWTRTSCGLAAAAALYLLGIAQRAGTPAHDHHLVWLLALLCASPSGDALSVDAALAARRAAPPLSRPSPAYAIPLCFAWALVGAIFFFPGAWKLIAGGGGWLSGEALRGHLHWKWAEMGWVPAIRVDRWPLACTLGGAATVLFEISFGFLIFVPALRPWVVGAALAFHALSGALMRVYFSSLWVTYVMFVDWSRVLPSVGLARWIRTAASGSARPLSLASVAVGGALLVGAVASGALGITEGWPFACYPTFHATPGPVMPGLVLEGVRADGTTVELPHGPLLAGARRQRAWGIVWSLVGARGAPVDERRLAAYWMGVRETEPARSMSEGVTRVRFHRVWYSTDPDRRGAPPVERELIAEIAR